MAKLV